MGWTSASTPKYENENCQNCWIDHRGSGPGRGIDHYNHRPRTANRRQFRCIQRHYQLAGIFSRRTGRRSRPDFAESIPDRRSARRDWFAKRWRRRLARGGQGKMISIGRENAKPRLHQAKTLGQKHSFNHESHDANCANQREFFPTDSATATDKPRPSLIPKDQRSEIPKPGSACLAEALA